MIMCIVIKFEYLLQTPSPDTIFTKHPNTMHAARPGRAYNHLKDPRALQKRPHCELSCMLC